MSMSTLMPFSCALKHALITVLLTIQADYLQKFIKLNRNLPKEHSVRSLELRIRSKMMSYIKKVIKKRKLVENERPSLSSSTIIFVISNLNILNYAPHLMRSIFCVLSIYFLVGCLALAHYIHTTSISIIANTM